MSELSRVRKPVDQGRPSAVLSGRMRLGLTGLRVTPPQCLYQAGPRRRDVRGTRGRQDSVSLPGGAARLTFDHLRVVEGVSFRISRRFRPNGNKPANDLVLAMIRLHTARFVGDAAWEKTIRRSRL